MGDAQRSGFFLDLGFACCAASGTAAATAGALCEGGLQSRHADVMRVVRVQGMCFNVM
jgi:hypothetical protein